MSDDSWTSDDALCELLRGNWQADEARMRAEDADQLRVASKEDAMSDDDRLCWNCGQPESEHAAHGDWCPVPDDESSELFSKRLKFAPDPPPHDDEWTAATRAEHDEAYSIASELDADEWDAEWTAATRAEYSAWADEVDEIYAAEELARIERERDEDVGDH